MNREDQQIDQEALNKFLEAKKQFAGFKNIDSVPEDKIQSDLPVFTEDENAQRVLKAMERLYGSENVIHDVLGSETPEFKPTSSNKTPKKKSKRK